MNINKLRVLFDLLVLAALCFVLLKFNAREPEYRLISPLYWWQRVQGRDLYDPRGILWHGNRTVPEIALTFDDGPNPTTTPRVLDALRAEGVQATFFVLGKRIKEHPDIVKRMLEEGHEVGCHSYDHQNQTTLTQQQVWQQIWDSRILIGRVNSRFTAYRPPWLEWNENVLNAVREHQLPVVMCTYASDPQASRSGEKWARIVSHHTHNGSILLLHDTYPTTAQDLPYLLRELKRKGYRFVTITQMMKNLP